MEIRLSQREEKGIEGFLVGDRVGLVDIVGESEGEKVVLGNHTVGTREGEKVGILDGRKEGENEGR